MATTSDGKNRREEDGIISFYFSISFGAGVFTFVGVEIELLFLRRDVYLLTK